MLRMLTPTLTLTLTQRATRARCLRPHFVGWLGLTPWRHHYLRVKRWDTIPNSHTKGARLLYLGRRLDTLERHGISNVLEVSKRASVHRNGAARFIWDGE